MRTKVFRACMLALPLLGIAASAWADPVWGEQFQLRQPGGEMVTVRIWGDEFYQVVESLDGFTLTRDPLTHEICYAQLSQDGRELVSSGVRVGDAAKALPGVEPHLRLPQDVVETKARAARSRKLPSYAVPLSSQKALPPYQGSTVGICLIVDFPDEAGTITPSEVDNFCNLNGYSADGNDGSVRDFFSDVSGGALDYSFYIPSAYYTTTNNKSYYDDPSDDSGVGARALIYEALQDLDDSGFDFSQYDVNDDGLVDAVNCLYAGYTSSGWSMGLWPHSGVLFPPLEFDGVYIGQYQMTYMGSTLHIGTFCHENGHLLCKWPDLYDYGYESEGLGRHCLMSGGNHANGGRNPVAPCAYLRDLAGWTTTTLLEGLGQDGLASTTASNLVYKYAHPTNPKEYFLIENRQKTGRDAYKPDGGLEILHIDRDGDNDREDMTPERHYRVTLVQADGNWDLENNNNSGDTTDLWKAPAFTECGIETIPNTNWWDGSVSYLGISNISADAATMTFDYSGPGSASDDTDGDGMSDWDETRDLDPDTPGLQNPFDPEVADSTGDNGVELPDGVLDGENDFDGDGLSNADEFRLGGNPLDANSHLPSLQGLGLAVLGLILLSAAGIAMKTRAGAPGA